MKSLVILLSFALATVWAQNVTLELGTKRVGTRGALNLEAGNGILEFCQDEGATSNRITCKSSYNSALIATHDSVHNNENYCSSTTGTTMYACKLPDKAITAYQAGMTFLLLADATCKSSCTLNVDTVGPVSIKTSDGRADPGGTLVAGDPQWVFYDGRVFRLMGGSGERRRIEAGDRAQDVTARRFIATMETASYANVVTLETTAGDIHEIATDAKIGNCTLRAATAGIAGQHMWVIIVNDSQGARTIAFGEHLRAAGALTGAPGKAATLQFISDGTAWYEVARTANL